MDFGDILDEWDRETAKSRGKPKNRKPGNDNRPQSADLSSGSGQQELPVANPMDVWLRRYGITDKDADPRSGEEPPHIRRRRLRSMRCEARIDLHGLTRDDAWIRLEAFFADCVRRKLEKVLIIHGKGTHSDDDPVLRRMVQLFIEKHPHAGESGYSSKGEGGSGSTWVILK